MAAAYRATNSGVNSFPTMPRIPDTLVISVSLIELMAPSYAWETP
jgi:hypothetical protein